MRDRPYFDSPKRRAWCRTLICATRGPAIDAIAGMKRCISEYSGMRLIRLARNALSEQPLSRIGTPVTLPISQLAMREGILRDTSLSWRLWRQPTTRSKPASICSSSSGMSAGSFCRSPSMVTSTSPLRVLDARRHRGRLTVVAAELDDAQPRVAARERGSDRDRVVLAAVVDEHHLERAAQLRRAPARSPRTAAGRFPARCTAAR